MRSASGMKREVGLQEASLYSRGLKYFEPISDLEGTRVYIYIE